MKVRNQQKRKVFGRQRRHRRVRAKIFGTSGRPRLSVFRSAKHLTAQLIDDAERRTLAVATDVQVKVNEKGKVAVAEAVGRLIGEKAREKGITQIVFDRGGFTYHGRVEAVARGARAAGLEF